METIKIEPIYQVRKNIGINTIAEQLKESEVVSLYIDYFNNFLTVEKFAEYYSYPLSDANYIINTGRKLNNK